MATTLSPFVAAMIIPTGVGASIGGYGGDATVSMNLLASVCDVLITHPNVANAACFQQLPANALYVEGYGLDRFFEGAWHLQPVRQNRIGVVLDRGIEPGMKTLHINTINAVATTYGVDIACVVETETPVNVSCTVDDSGASSGRINNPHTLLHACEKALKQGATALALCVQMPCIEGDTAYKQGEGVDPIGGIEALLSHTVVATFGVPCAHAPVFNWNEAEPLRNEIVDPRAASECIVPTFLPCVLTGLSRAPQFSKTDTRQSIGISQLSALVIPADCLGGLPTLSCIERNIPVIAVESNTSVMAVTAKSLGEPPTVTHARNYAEATGLLAAMRLGLNPANAALWRG